MGFYTVMKCIFTKKIFFLAFELELETGKKNLQSDKSKKEKKDKKWNTRPQYL